MLTESSWGKKKEIRLRVQARCRRGGMENEIGRSDVFYDRTRKYSPDYFRTSHHEVGEKID